MARAGWDNVTIDMQHGTASCIELLSILSVIRQTGMPALVRVAWTRFEDIKRAVLDRSARGWRMATAPRQQVNDAVLPIAMIELTSALHHLDENLQLLGLGAIYVGRLICLLPCDLSRV